ncbi:MULTISPECIES: hypothetical protein [Methylobacterium]|uniref:Secreted protein n=3 Tax=Pseudomonadota TaxID=1224 RepID=A0ABQ4ST76_9HYPH|nr:MULTISPECIES: hypothetical protein [Methylobacterium]PIU07549.1 MAG: hypothetical protein COT56_04835 [Methylobacterium sp. CG09_land_8_20_14_0_10_71_15]PIU13336.1 MAG: hypothetical protein COT28_11975 [Methylobacterium sp. CG08_land_8_20_14_0_20_71_15]GBU17751.1 hypothetical protein AwMethylo_19660 [Methylobacterium sp.]GJE06419.1 hypothetical protein AOPFMNJM_1737 [Methylobacterium jeotgali]
MSAVRSPSALLPLACLVLSGVCPAPAGAQGGPPGNARPPAAQTAKAPPSPQVLGCPSLANLLRILGEGRNERGVAAFLADAKADHLGCTGLSRERVAGLSGSVTLGGGTYDCLTLRDTAVCHWTQAGALPVPAPAKATGAPAAGKPVRAP